MRDSHYLIRAVAILLGVIVPSALKASDEVSLLASTERRLQAVYETVGPAAVRIALQEENFERVQLA